MRPVALRKATTNPARSSAITQRKFLGPPRKWISTEVSPMESTLYAARHTPLVR